MASSRLEGVDGDGSPSSKLGQPQLVRVDDPHSARAVRINGHPSSQLNLRQQLLSAIPPDRLARSSKEEIREELVRILQGLCAHNSESASWPNHETIIQEVLDEVYGYGPIEGLMHDHEVSEILINGPRQLFIEKRGQLQPTDITFRDEDQLARLVQRMSASAARKLDAKSPMLDARLPDGSRVNIVAKPPALNGPLISIRRFGVRPLTVDDLLVSESLTKEMLDFLSACVRGRVSMIISGGTGSGKTTLLNALSRFIPDSERVITIEDTAELELQQSHVAKMEAQPADMAGVGAVSMRDLVRNSLRMRPDRIIVGECRGAEVIDMFQAMNTGHEGSMTTIHANSTREALTRVELMISLAGIDVTERAIRKLIASSVNLIVQVSRVAGGKRKIVAISEITGMEGETVSMHDLFEFVQTGVDKYNAVEGYFRATGIRPQLLKKLNARGAALPIELFMERRLQSPKNREPGK
ncbi:MAG: CpaF family protein [Gemmataceae bacterium]